MRKSFGAIALAVALAFVGACGTSGGSDSSSNGSGGSGGSGGGSGGSSETVKVDAWAEDFCGAFKGWIADIKASSSKVNQGVTAGDVEGAKTAIVGLFEDASERTQQLISDVDEAGIPDVDDGDKLVADLSAKFQDFDDAIQAAKAEAEDLETDAPVKFKADVGTLVKTFQDETQKVGDSFAELDSKYGSKDLDAALNEHCAL